MPRTIYLAEKVATNWRIPKDLKEAVISKAAEVRRDPGDLVEVLLRDGLQRVVAVKADDVASEV